MSSLIANPLLLTPAASDDTYVIKKSLANDWNEWAHFVQYPQNDGSKTCFTIALWLKPPADDSLNKTIAGMGGYMQKDILGVSTSYKPGDGFIMASPGNFAFYYTNASGTEYLVNWENYITHDTNAWMHVVFNWDSNNDEADDRARLYINGQRIERTSTSPHTIPHGETTRWNSRHRRHFLLSRNDDYASETTLTQWHFDGAVADFYHIDGEALGPWCFGKFDDNEVWQPRKFKYPSLYDGTIYSNQVSGTNAAAQGDHLFDGWNNTNASPGNGESLTWTGSIKAENKIRLMIRVRGTNDDRFKINGVSYGKDVAHHNGSSLGWYTLRDKETFKPIREITSLFWDAVSNSDDCTIQLIEVDDILLMDGRKSGDDPKRVNINNCHKWTDGSGLGANAFNGQANNFGTTLSANTWTTITNHDIPVTRGLEINCDNDHAITIKDNSGTEYGVEPGDAHKWRLMTNQSTPDTIAPAYTGTLTGPVQIKTAGANDAIRNIRVDGCVLTEHTDDNSWHLNFEDHEELSKIGKSLINREIADVKPILVTTDDAGYGETTAGTVDTSDSNKTHLKLALPMKSDLNDVHHTVKGSGSAITITPGNVKVSSRQSRFYGTSGDFAHETEPRQISFSNSDGHFDIPADTAYCIEMWIYFSDVPSGNRYIIDSSSSGGSRIYLYQAGDGRISGDIGGNLGNIATLGDETNASQYGLGLCIKGWNHFAITRKSTGAANAWVNGAKSMAWTSSTAISPGDTIYIGGHNGGAVTYNGAFYMQDFRWYIGTHKYSENFNPACPKDWLPVNITGGSAVSNTAKLLDAGDRTAELTGDSTISNPGYAFNKDITNYAYRNTSSSSAHITWTPGSAITGHNGYIWLKGGNGDGGGIKGKPNTGNNPMEVYVNDSLVDHDDIEVDYAACRSTSYYWDGWFKIPIPSSFTSIKLKGAYALVYGYAFDASHAQQILDDCAVYSGPTNEHTNITNDTPTASGTESDPPAGGEKSGLYAGLQFPVDNTHRIFRGGKAFMKDTSSAAHVGITGSMGVKSGKWYFEAFRSLENTSPGHTSDNSTGASSSGIGFTTEARWRSGYPGDSNSDWNWIYMADTVYRRDGNSNNATAFTDNAISRNNGTFMVALDMDNKRGWVGKDGVWFTASAKTGGTAGDDGTTAMWTDFIDNEFYFPYFHLYQTFESWHVNFGQNKFIYTPPTGFKSWMPDNLPQNSGNDVQKDPKKAFEQRRYYGTSIDDKKFKDYKFNPGLIWTKSFSHGGSNNLASAKQGATKVLWTNTNDALYTQTDGVKAYGTKEYTVGTNSQVNANNYTYVNNVWRTDTVWDSTDGDITAGTVASSGQRDSHGGVSVVKFTGTGAQGTVGHALLGADGLAAKPEFIMMKNLDDQDNWRIGHRYANNFVNTSKIDTAEAFAADAAFDGAGNGSSGPTTTVFHVSDNAYSNPASSESVIAYCFTGIPGFSKFGWWQGNALSREGNFINLGFKPALFMFKKRDESGSWWIWSSIMNPFNSWSSEMDTGVALWKANEPDAGVFDQQKYRFDAFCNGIVANNSDEEFNGNNDVYMYAAWAEAPYNSNSRAYGEELINLRNMM